MKALALSFVFTSLLLLPVPTLAPAQTQSAADIRVTDTMPNGRFWSGLTQSQKSTWLVGYSDGIKTALVFVYGAEPANKLLQQAILDLQPTNKLTLAEIAQGMDRFYQDTPENAPVPLRGAMSYVERKASGATKSELDDFASGLRKASIQLSTQ